MERRMFLVSLLSLPFGMWLQSLRQGIPREPKQRTLPAHLFSPAEGTKLAALDAVSLKDAAVKEADRLKALGKTEDADDILKQLYGYRYLYLGNLFPDERVEYVKLIDFTLNSLSTRKVLVFCSVVPGTENALVRVKLDEYNIDPKKWDELGAKGSGPIRSVKKTDDPEPYFHTSLRKVIKTPSHKEKRQVQRRDDKGRLLYHTKPDGSVDESNPAMEEKEVDVPSDTAAVSGELQHAPWIPSADITALALALETDFPIFRADWFVCNALLAPAYNEFFGFHRLGDIQKVARFRKADLEFATRGVVTESDEVAIHQRAVQSTPTSLGYYWETLDYLTSIREDDLLEDLRLQRRDAGEIIFNLPNGLQGYGLVNGKDEVIDFADPNVASDTRTVWRNKLVWTGVSCITCHDAGIKPVTDEVRLMSNDRVALLVKNRADFKAVVDLFSTPLAGANSPVEASQAIYARSLAVVTKGWTPKVLSQKLSDAFLRYVQAPVDLTTVAMECGVPPDKILEVIGRIRGPNHTLSQLFLKRPVRRDQWSDKGFAQLMTILYPAGTVT